MSNKTIGEFIKELRLSKNISTSEIAKNLTISEAKYIKCENGESSIYVDDLKNIASMLSVNESTLIEKYID
ncbi:MULTISPECIES: helix-turn-helix domain-containing protein [Providencia]|uniref:Helix-turn-helix domain-containing protein n=2 Tax=Providencia TaxID=586 RepID=A0ABU2IWU6_9GAMM|nr:MULTISPECIES: helix-turn-helix transcriptional regulator [Providencia]MBO8253807.1 helix-turn-helix transcriptional regulator [Providencia rettgeri]MBO8257651.1 helix-turn-helix transcriptional regulator [Providencia rettgeri]MDE4731587.1 helix-turn-helix transcriptional regulator [Providencia rettgeri]MDH2304663.1 helix-turn-helix transcriptional regulator [Providencia rettgeri]MDT0133515.1 helix-turn-helix domain-containing protein [Providencia huaxiensis]